jgi:AcrR family transcriptional regulator
MVVLYPEGAMESVSAAERPVKSRAQQGKETRRSILKAAMDIASTHGLDGLSLGELAKELRMSKSGLFARFGSKEELQIATIEAAEDVFAERVIQPARAAPRGASATVSPPACGPGISSWSGKRAGRGRL